MPRETCVPARVPVSPKGFTVGIVWGLQEEVRLMTIKRENYVVGILGDVRCMRLPRVDHFLLRKTAIL